MNDIGQLLEEQLPRLRRYARTLTRDADRADDLVQSCVVRALAKQHLWREGTDLRTWLFTILHNQHINELRSKARERQQLAVVRIQPASLPGSDPELSYHVHELERALKTLPKSQRDVIWRISLHREDYLDVARSLRVPIGTVRSRFSRARESLRAMADRL